MYNRVYDFLTENTENKILYEKLSGFQSAHSGIYNMSIERKFIWTVRIINECYV